VPAFAGTTGYGRLDAASLASCSSLGKPCRIKPMPDQGSTFRLAMRAGVLASVYMPPPETRGNSFQARGIATTCSRISAASAPGTRTPPYAMASKSDQNLNAIYKSTDGGATWTSLSTTGITDILGGQGFYNHAILIDPSNASTVYLGGQLYMAKSTSGGTSWTKKTDWLAQGGLPYVHADFHCGAMVNSSTMYAGTDGGIFKSTDGGTTWTSSLNIGITSHLNDYFAIGLGVNAVKVFAEQDEGTVIAQNPRAGERAGEGTSVRINVSKGSGVVNVPSVVGLARSDAEATLTAAGLRADGPERQKAAPAVAHSSPRRSRVTESVRRTQG